MLLTIEFHEPRFPFLLSPYQILTKLVIVLPLLGVSQDFIRFRDTFELFLRLPLPSKDSQKSKNMGPKSSEASTWLHLLNMFWQIDLHKRRMASS